MVAAFANTVSTTLGSRTHTFQRSGTIYKNCFYNQFAFITTFILLFPVVNCAQRQFTQGHSRMFWMMFQYGHGAFYFMATYQLSKQTHFAWRCGIIAQFSYGFHFYFWFLVPDSWLATSNQ